ncbi:hypothetical protein WISP_47691 [Willisornis vidua]|uniref:Secreted protein n=1 Tax=Willisornis vidua TaxID=1566151 RepID=A0ABQ9DEP4_9PASS|nr:hypothetical protein WISP_47691 [Willisornis vidua]
MASASTAAVATTATIVATMATTTMGTIAIMANQTPGETLSAGNHAANICSSNGIVIHRLLIGAWQRWELFASPGFAQSHNSLPTRVLPAASAQGTSIEGRCGADLAQEAPDKDCEEPPTTAKRNLNSEAD